MASFKMKMKKISLHLIGASNEVYTLQCLHSNTDHSEQMFKEIVNVSLNPFSAMKLHPELVSIVEDMSTMKIMSFILDLPTTIISTQETLPEP